MKWLCFASPGQLRRVIELVGDEAADNVSLGPATDPEAPEQPFDMRAKPGHHLKVEGVVRAVAPSTYRPRIAKGGMLPGSYAAAVTPVISAQDSKALVRAARYSVAVM